MPVFLPFRLASRDAEIVCHLCHKRIRVGDLYVILAPFSKRGAEHFPNCPRPVAPLPFAKESFARVLYR